MRRGATARLVDAADRVIGVSNVRHELTPARRAHGGHIGFVVRPSARRQGHGVRVLERTLAWSRAHGLGRALLTCDATNAGSRRVIETCGGSLDVETVSPATGVLIRRYWIDLGGPSERVVRTNAGVTSTAPKRVSTARTSPASSGRPNSRAPRSITPARSARP